jgi:hypothetical protein
MRSALWMSVPALALGLAPASAPANGWLPPIKIDAGAKAWFNVHIADRQTNVGPWYLYFPYDAHFQTGAPGMHFPNWPSHMTPQAANPHGPQLAPQVPQLVPPPAKQEPVSPPGKQEPAPKDGREAPLPDGPAAPDGPQIQSQSFSYPRPPLPRPVGYFVPAYYPYRYGW